MKTQSPFPFQDESLARYFEEIAQTPLLSFEEELELSRRIQGGDKTAQDRLVRANLRLVVKIAKAYQRYGLGFLDLIQEGNIGLMNAASKYDHQKNVRFSTYASWWIKQAIVRAIANKNRLIRLPHRKEEALRRMMRLINEAANQGKVLTTDSLCKDMGMDKEEVVALLEFSNSVTSLDKEVNDDASTFLDLIEDNSYQPDQLLFEQCFREDTKKLMEKLLDKERLILTHRFAFGGTKKATLKTIGEEMGLSAETVRQIEIRALQKLKVQKEEMQDYYYN